MFIKNKVIAAILLFCAAVFITGTAQSQEVLKRRNIDSLTPQEMAAYEHALQVLNDKSVKFAYDQDGYAWQAWVHNNSYVSVPQAASRPINPGETPTAYYKAMVRAANPGGKPGYPGECEHGKDLFLFWHRAEFYYFEKTLQNADPAGNITDSKGHTGPSTAKVTIPYWNFTKPASGVGKRFPKAFENQASILYHAGRASGVPDYPYTKKDMIQKILNNKWTAFGGFPNGTGGGSAFLDGGYGLFESEVHNPMHATYCGGDMGDNVTAAYDPIFYSFHAYLDFVFDEWLRINNMEATGKNGTDSITSLNYHLRGQLPAKYNLPNYDPGKGNRPTMSKCALYLDHAKLGYEYEVSPADRYDAPDVPIALLMDNNGAPVVFGKNAMSPQALLADHTFLAPTAKEGVKKAAGTVSHSTMPIHNGYLEYETSLTGSFKVDVYIHPKSVKAAIANKAFRNKYLASSATYWKLEHDGMTHGTAAGKTDLNIFILAALEDIRKNANPDEWVITTNLTRL